MAMQFSNFAESGTDTMRSMKREIFLYDQQLFTRESPGIFSSHA